MPDQIERLTQAISREVVLIDKSSLTSLSLVIRPDPNTELNVQFRRQDGEIEVRIRCNHGDQQLWQRHWPELQSLLAEKSVRLLPFEEQRVAPLDHALSANPDSSAQSEKRSQPDLPDHPTAPNQWPNSNPRSHASHPATTSKSRLHHHGWETWA